MANSELRTANGTRSASVSTRHSLRYGEDCGASVAPFAVTRLFPVVSMLRRHYVLNGRYPSVTRGTRATKIEGFHSMSRSTIATLIATAFVAIVVAVPSKADEPGSTEAKKHHAKHHAPAVQYAAVPANPYGLPASYYPAPPFPFFLVPGPWWLPAHP
jgi:hypothetical protein